MDTNKLINKVLSSVDIALLKNASYAKISYFTDVAFWEDGSTGRIIQIQKELIFKSKTYVFEIEISNIKEIYGSENHLKIKMKNDDLIQVYKLK